jgi:hypothetical protein
MTQETRSLIIYGPHLFRELLSSPSWSPPPWVSFRLILLHFLSASKLAKLLKGLCPISSSTVVVPEAFLSFDVKGIPFLEPCYCNSVVQGFNDRNPSEQDISEKGKEVEGRESEEYKRWIWSKCSSGAEYEGMMPHPLEVSLSFPTSAMRCRSTDRR